MSTAEPTNEAHNLSSMADDVLEPARSIIGSAEGPARSLHVGNCRIPWWTEVSGGSWTTLEVVGPSDSRSSGGWNRVSFLVSDYVTPSDSVRVRFTAEDANAGSVIEAAIDGLSIEVVSCDDAFSPGDINRDGLIDGQDLSIVLGFWGPCEDPSDCVADLTLDGVVDGQDLSIVLGFWSL